MGALWFVPMLFFSVIFFAFLDKNVNKLKTTQLVKKIIIFVATIVIGAAGTYATEKQYGLLHNIQIAYLFVPIILFGHLSKRIGLKKYCGAICVCITFFIMAIILHSNVGIIELSKFKIINRWLFYPITIIGILFCFSLTNVLYGLNNKIKELLVKAGKNSFDIMALHFICFKIIDFMLCKSLGKENILANFPHSFDSIWIIYVIGGVGIPLFFVRIKEWAKGKIIGEYNE